MYFSTYITPVMILIHVLLYGYVTVTGPFICTYFFIFIFMSDLSHQLTMTAVTAPFYGSCSLQLEWTESCQKVMGYESASVAEAKVPGLMTASASSDTIILNLLEEGDDDYDDHAEDISNHDEASFDPWIGNAILIDNGMDQIISLLQRKKSSYLSASNSDDTDASLLESTILSFVATTANQLEFLRKTISTVKNHDYVQHCSGIVACLLLTLRHDIAEPFGTMQKLRSRAALTLYQCPLQCRILLEHLEGRDIRMIPEHDIKISSGSFMSLYDDKDQFETSDLVRPKSRLDNTRSSTKSPQLETNPISTKQKQPKSEPLPYQQQPDVSPSRYQESMIQEALILQVILTNDLDTVQQVEARMTEITTLLSQFSALVSEQQQDIEVVYETTVQSKENVQKGQESLVDAAQRTKQSKHRMATVVFVMALTLLFFNYITP